MKTGRDVVADCIVQHQVSAVRMWCPLVSAVPMWRPLVSAVRVWRPLVSAIVRRVRADGGRVALACRSVGQLGEKGNAIPSQTVRRVPVAPRPGDLRCRTKRARHQCLTATVRPLARSFHRKPMKRLFVCLSLSSVQDYVCLDIFEHLLKYSLNNNQRELTSGQMTSPEQNSKDTNPQR